MPLIDRLTGEWSAAVAERVGISVNHLPPLSPSGSVVGPILPSVADQLGLPRTVQIINGGQDHACEALALGLTNPGSLMLATGTAWVITGIADSPDIDSIPPQMDLNAHVVPDRWTISTYMGGFGAIVEWWLNAAPSSREDKYALLQRALETSQPGSSGLLFIPESRARTASQFSGLKLSHTWADMTRAVVEGIAFEVRHMVEALRRSNLPVQALYMLGGAARNAQWRHILADVLAVPIIGWDDPYLGARGAAQLAARGGGFSNWEKGYIPSEAITHPDPALRALYDERYVAYQTH
jgi:xylulokinase